MNFPVIILNSGFRIPDSRFRIPDSGFRVPVSGFRLLGLPAKGEGANINCSKKEHLFKQKNQFHDDKIRYREAMSMIVLKEKEIVTESDVFVFLKSDAYCIEKGQKKLTR